MDDQCFSDEINQSSLSHTPLNQSQIVNQDTIKKKYDELKKQYELI